MHLVQLALLCMASNNALHKPLPGRYARLVSTSLQTLVSQLQISLPAAEAYAAMQNIRPPVSAPVAGQQFCGILSPHSMCLVLRCATRKAKVPRQRWTTLVRV